MLDWGIVGLGTLEEGLTGEHIKETKTAANSRKKIPLKRGGKFSNRKQNITTSKWKLPLPGRPCAGQSKERREILDLDMTAEHSRSGAG